LISNEIGDTSKAISNLQTAVEQDPNMHDAYMQLGLLHSTKNDDLALDYFDNALEVDSNSVDALYGKAMFHQERSNYAKAKKFYKDIIEIEPQYGKAFYNIGYICFQQDSLAKAFRHFNIATNVSPDYAEAYYMKGLTAESQGDHEKAKRNYRQALGIKPDYELAQKGMKRINEGKEM